MSDPGDKTVRSHRGAQFRLGTGPFNDQRLRMGEDPVRESQTVLFAFPSVFEKAY